MIDTVLQKEAGTVTVKVNSKDEALADVLRQRQFEKTQKDVSGVELDLSGTLDYDIPGG